MITYFLISVERHPWARDIKDKDMTESGLTSFGCDDFQYYAYMTAQGALSMGLTREAARSHLDFSLDKAYGLGDGVLPPVTTNGDAPNGHWSWRQSYFQMVRIHLDCHRHW